MDDQRLDKWLWCARFFKTRSLAQAAIKAGRISVNGERPKPSRGLVPGDTLCVRLPPFEHHLEVLGLAKQRVGAALTVNLFRESPASRERRAELALQLRLAASSDNLSPGGLDKRARRERVALKRAYLESVDESPHESL